MAVNKDYERMLQQMMMQNQMQMQMNGLPGGPVGMSSPMPGMPGMSPAPPAPGGGGMPLPEANALSTAQEKALQDIGRQKIRGMDSIMGAKSTTGGTALAKTIAAGLSGHFGRKEQKGEMKAFRKAAQKEADDLAADEARRIAKEAADQARLDEMLGLKKDTLATRTTQKFWHPTEKGKVLNLQMGKDGQYYDVDTRKPYDGEVKNLVTWTSQNSKQQDIKAAENAAEAEELQTKTARDVESISTLLGQDKATWMASTGALDPEAIVGGVSPRTYNAVAGFLGTDEGAIGEQIQSHQRRMNQIKVTAAAPVLEILGPKPTDFDAKLALTTVPTDGSEPQVWVDWVRESYAPLVRDTIMSNADTQDQIDRGNAAYDKLLAEATDLEARIYGDEKAFAPATVTATNPETGEKLQLVNGKWVPI